MPIFVFVSCPFVVRSKKSLLKSVSIGLFPMFSPRNFVHSGLTFKSLIHFGLFFVYSVRKGFNFILLHVDIQFSQHYLLKRLSFPHWVFLALLLKIDLLYMYGFTSGLSILFLWSMSVWCQYHTILIIVKKMMYGILKIFLRG